MQMWLLHSTNVIICSPCCYACFEVSTAERLS